jgi:hypothetical protein
MISLRAADGWGTVAGHTPGRGTLATLFGPSVPRLLTELSDQLVEFVLK